MVVLGVSCNLWCHIDDIAEFGVSASGFFGESEVDDLDLIELGDEYVFGGDVSVEEAVVVYFFESLEYLCE